MMTTAWKSQEVRSFNGLVCANGDIYEVRGSRLARVREKYELDAWLNVAILAQEELYGGEYVVKCGEALEHGSIGVIVLESLQNRQPIWTFASYQSNPFDQILVKAGWVLVVSTSGAVFRFRPPLQEVTLLIAC